MFGKKCREKYYTKFISKFVKGITLQGRTTSNVDKNICNEPDPVIRSY